MVHLLGQRTQHAVLRHEPEHEQSAKSTEHGSRFLAFSFLQQVLNPRQYVEDEMGIHLGFEVPPLGFSYLLFEQYVLLSLRNALHQKLFFNQLFPGVFGMTK